jgi:hypothetical protein
MGVSEQKNDPRPSKEQNQKNEGFTKSQLTPIEDRLKEHGYPPHIIENYPKLVRKDLRLAEVYRFAATGAPNPVIEKRRLLNPIQTKVDRNGKIWVDVLCICCYQ